MLEILIATNASPFHLSRSPMTPRGNDAAAIPAHKRRMFPGPTLCFAGAHEKLEFFKIPLPRIGFRGGNDELVRLFRPIFFVDSVPSVGMGPQSPVRRMDSVSLPRVVLNKGP